MRWIWTLLSAVVVLAVAAVALVLILPGERIARIAADQVRAQTGRELVFTGEVGISWYPVLGVTTGPVSLGNADWSEAGPMFRAESAAIGVDVLAAIGGDIRIKRIEAVRPEILLEKAADGRVNWEFGDPGAEAAAPASGGAGLGSVTLERLDVRNARLRYVDHGGDSFEQDGVDAALIWPDPAAPAEISLTVRPAGRDVSLDATVEDPEGLLAGGLSRLQARIEADGGAVAFDGRAGLDPQAAGRIDADLPRPAAFLAALGLSGWPGGKAAVSGEITLTSEGRFSLRDGKVSALGNALSVQADVSPGADRPEVIAQVVAGRLDLTALTGGSDDAPAGAGWSKAPIDMSFLGTFDGEIGLRADAIALGNLEFGASRLVARVDRSRAVFTLRELRGYEGLITGEFVANNRSGLSVGGTMKAEQVELKSLLDATMGVDRLSGKADAQLSFLGVGPSVHAIMNSLSGDGAVVTGRGIINGIDLDKLFRGQASGGSTVFDKLTGTFQIADGVVRNEDLLLELPSIIGRGKGTVGLGAQNIDYTFTPQFRRETEDGLAVPVRFKGPWSDMRVWPDLEAVIDQNFQEEKKALQDKAEQRIKEKLGIDTEEGTEGSEGSVEDELKRKAKDKLLDFLGGSSD